MRGTRYLLVLSLLLLVATGFFTEATAHEDESASAETRRFVFVVNRIDARSVALASARDALALFAAENMVAGDQAMVVEIGYSTRVLGDFSDSKDATIALIRGITPMSVDTPARVATRQFYASLRELGNTLEDVPGRKVVILASNEPNRARSGKLYVADTVAALNRGNASVYSIDLGLLHRSFVRGGVGGLSPLSTETGGEYFHNLSRVSFVAAMRQIAESVGEAR